VCPRVETDWADLRQSPNVEKTRLEHQGPWVQLYMDFFESVLSATRLRQPRTIAYWPDDIDKMAASYDIELTGIDSINFFLSGNSFDAIQLSLVDKVRRVGKDQTRR